MKQSKVALKRVIININDNFCRDTIAYVESIQLERISRVTPTVWKQREMGIHYTTVQ